MQFKKNATLILTYDTATVKIPVVWEDNSIHIMETEYPIDADACNAQDLYWKIVRKDQFRPDAEQDTSYKPDMDVVLWADPTVRSRVYQAYEDARFDSNRNLTDLLEMAEA